ncbi:hypothetical protein MOQ72_13485 [Saccharopolyspora sp. K220]|nr:hypothetical protein [Saccharopolyspora soli]MCI2418445.1 hypothetical protein [Saccharopolyspora soli]
MSEAFQGFEDDLDPIGVDAPQTFGQVGSHVRGDGSGGARPVLGQCDA